jgi:hypothetical protein
MGFLLYKTFLLIQRFVIFLENVKYGFIFVDEEDFKKYNPKTFTQLIQNFRKYKDD